MNTFHTHPVRRSTAAAVLLAATLLAGCGSSDDSASDDATSDGAPADGASEEAGGESAPADDAATAPLTLTDGWVIAGDEGMSSAFGTLVNSSTDDIVVEEATSSASPEIELHETVADDSGEMVMREIDGGFVIPAGGELTLEPGGNHLMLMDVVEPLLAGDQLDITLTLADGSDVDLVLDIRDFEGGHEHYEDEGGSSHGSDDPDDGEHSGDGDGH
ncbi:Copper metallochaperone, bacterial analog of Cox17 protein [Actinomycetales bacterium JB111]|nr:Copper metallochaperone, bacterial analog of Cox17 protein [Actinomycetales bacterium JB111]